MRTKASKATRGPAPATVIPQDVKGVLSARQVAAALGISRRNLKGMLSAGEYPPHDFAIGSLHRWTVATHNAWVASRAEGKARHGGR